MIWRKHNARLEIRLGGDALAGSLLLLLLIFSLRGSAMADGKLVMGAAEAKPAETSPNGSTVTIPFHLFERLLDDFKPKTVATLFDYLSIDPEEQEKIYPAYQIAEKAAKEKQRALSSAGAGKIVLKVGDAVTIHGLDETAIDACIEVFSKNLKIAISDNTRKAICILQRRELKRDFSKTFTIQLQKEVRTVAPDGTIVISGGGFSTFDMRHTPPHLSGYYFRIYRLIGGKPAPGTETDSPSQTEEGKRYDFLSIETGEDAAKPAAEKTMQVPKKKKRH